MISVSDGDAPKDEAGSPSGAAGGDEAVGAAEAAGGVEGVEGVDAGTAAGADVPLSVLVTVYDPVEAEIVLGKLRSAGIEAYAAHDAMSVVYGLTVDGFGRHDVLVRSEDLDDARAALA